MESLQRAGHPLGLNHERCSGIWWITEGRIILGMVARRTLNKTLRPKSISKIGCWNVRAMYECGKAKRNDDDTQKLG